MIVDDHAAYRAGLANLLRESDIEVAGAEPSVEAAVRALAVTGADVVILDLRLHAVSGSGAIARLKEAAPGCRVLVVSVAAQDIEISDAIFAGASGHLPKDRPVEDVTSWIRAAATGEPAICPQAARALLRRLRERSADGKKAGTSLGVGELEVLELFAQGLGIEDVSRSLVIGRRAVADLAASILAKVHSRESPREAKPQ
jgi:DNA-binding NarL/FixJ family response regulator